MLAKREPPSRGGKAAKGFGPTRTSDQSDSVSCGDGPREPGISFGSDRARRGRRDLFRQVRVGSKGHPSDSSRTPTRKATAGHQCPWPSSEARPSPCAGVAARPEDVIPSGVRRGRTLRGPSGSHRVLRNPGGIPPAPWEPQGCRAVLRDQVADWRVPGKSSGFRERARSLSSRTFGSRRVFRRSA